MLSTMLSKSKTLKLVLLLSLTSCGDQFDWTPRPYVGDSVTQSLINSTGETVRCDQPIFDTMVCFDPANIAELRTAIGKIENDKRREKAMKAFRKTLPHNR